MRRILGIDPGSRLTGFGVLQISDIGRVQYVASGVIKTLEGGIPVRLSELFSGLNEVVKAYQPTEAAIEQVFMHRNAMSLIKLSQARGAAIAALSHQALTVSEYTARQVKQAVVGYGGAEKQQVQHMVQVLLNLSKLPPPDAADALAISWCHWQASSGQLGQAREKGFRKGRIKQ